MPDLREVPDSTPGDEQTAAVTLCLLGRPCLRWGARVIELSSKDAALLCLAALAAPIRSERVAAMLWPQATSGRADASLRQRVYRLRRETGCRLLAHGSTLGLDAAVATDLGRALADLSDDEHAAAEELLGDHSYEALPDFADWLRAQRNQWRLERMAALAACADRSEQDGALARALAYARRLIAGDALAEHAQRRLMRLHYLRGDRSAAIATFEAFERQLKDELGARPSAETLELLATIEHSDAVRSGARAVVPVALLRPPRLIGRRDELRRLDAAWATNRVFLLLGEAGIGKSRVLQEFGADRSGLVITQARPGDAGVAYALAARAVRAVLAVHALALDASRRRELALLLPEFGEALPISGDARRLTLQHSVERLLSEAMALGLRGLLLDDLHFADDASLGLLRAFVHGDLLASLRLGLTQRPAEGVAGVADLRESLEEVQRLEVISLAPMDAGQLAELVASLDVRELDADTLAAALHKHTGGNPLFALETLKELVLRGADGDERLPQPASVGALVERRLARLSAPALRLARVAALAQGCFDAELAAAVLDAHPLDLAEPWRELETAHVVRDGVFAHDLIYEATRHSVPAAIAQLLHRSVAWHLVGRNAPPSVIAPHWAGALEWSRCGESYALAARLARSASQRRHEADCWRDAAQAFEAAGEAARAFNARCESVQATIVVHGIVEAQRLVDILLNNASDDCQRAAAWVARATASLMAADHKAGIAAAAEAARLVRGAASPWAAFDAARLQAVGLTQAGRSAEALAAIEPYRALVEREGDAEQRGHFWADYAYVLNGVRRLRETAFALEQAIVGARDLGDMAELATLTSNLATVQGNLGHVRDALAQSRQALALQMQLGETDGPTGAVVKTYVGLYCGALGLYREALEHLDAALAVFTRDRQAAWFAVAAHHKATCLIDLGQFARARQALEYETMPTVDSVRARGHHLAARIERALGQSGQAPMQRALECLAAGGDPHVRMHALLDDQPPDDAAGAMNRCDEVLEMALRLEFAGVAAKARLRRAQVLCRCGHAAEAADVVRSVIAQMDETPPADMYLGEAWWIATQVFDAAGDHDDASMALAHGAQWVRRVALPQVPEEFRDSFLHRNPSNRALLAAADRRLG